MFQSLNTCSMKKVFLICVKDIFELKVKIQILLSADILDIMGIEGFEVIAGKLPSGTRSGIIILNGKARTIGQMVHSCFCLLCSDVN